MPGKGAFCLDQGYENLHSLHAAHSPTNVANVKSAVKSSQNHRIFYYPNNTNRDSTFQAKVSSFVTTKVLGKLGNIVVETLLPEVKVG